MYSVFKKVEVLLFSDRHSEVWLKGENETKLNGTGQTRIVQKLQLKYSTAEHREKIQGKGLKWNPTFPPSCHPIWLFIR